MNTPESTGSRGTRVLGGLSLAGLALLLGYALVWSPPDVAQQDSVRLMYVHVPTAILAFVGCFITTLASAMWLRRRSEGWWVLGGAAAEVGLVFTGICLLTGSIWGRPTWGTYWDWDPRLVSATVMMLAFMGVQTLRATLDDPDRRATWTSVASILAYTSVAVTYESVRIWRSIHQMQSSPDTVAKPMVAVLRLNAWAFLFLTTWMVVRRYRIAAARARAEEAPPLPDEVTA